MILLAAILAVVAVSAGIPMHSDRFIPSDIPLHDGRIVGGKDTTIDKYPHQISVERNRKHFCGGSLVTGAYAVTAAHCVIYGSILLYRVRAGTTTKEENGLTSDLDKLTYNPDFSLSKLDGDVGVLKLEIPLFPGFTAKPITLVPINEEPAANELLTVTGWGVTSNGNESKILQMVEVPAVDRQTCRKAYGEKITDTMICAGGSEKNACQGDSGGPLINSKKQLVGIVSWGRGCGSPGYPGVYGSIASPFIHNFITGWINHSVTTGDNQDKLKL